VVPEHEQDDDGGRHRRVGEEQHRQAVDVGDHTAERRADRNPSGPAVPTTLIAKPRRARAASDP
jgi:hypothetical protein